MCKRILEKKKKIIELGGIYLENLLDFNFKEIVDMIETRRNNAYKKVNEELISLYWDFGKYISEKINDNNWGIKS